MWVAEDVATGRPPTEFTADHLNAVQEEIAGVVEYSGQVLNKADNTQLRQALMALFALKAAAGVTVGAILAFPAGAAPTGFLKANGALVSRTAYAALWAFAQASGNLAASDAAWAAGQFSPGDGSTTFRIPDLRGEFLRAWDDGRGIDTGRGIGSEQADSLSAHTHIVGGSYGGTPGSGGIVQSLAGGAVSTQGQSPAGGTETRPRNVAVLFCLKY
jgi:phage-related tail fiber protein